MTFSLLHVVDIFFMPFFTIFNVFASEMPSFYISFYLFKHTFSFYHFLAMPYVYPEWPWDGGRVGREEVDGRGNWSDM